MKRWMYRCAAALAALLVCSSNGTGFAQTQMPKVRAMYFPGSLPAIPYLVAAERGFFAKNGLDVDLVEVTSGGASISAILSGSVEFTDGAAADLTFSAINKGQKLRGLTNLVRSNYYTIVGRPDLAYPNKGRPYRQALYDLKGRTIGVTGLGAFTDRMLRAMLTDAGINLNDVSIIPVGVTATALPALLSHKIDAYTAFSPMMELLAEKGGYESIVPVGKGPNRYDDYLLNHVVAKESYVTEHADIVKKFCTAMNESLVWEQDPKNFEALTALVGKRNPALTGATLEKSVRDILPVLSKDGKFSSGAFEHSNAVLKRMNVITAPVELKDYAYAPCQ